MTTLGQFKLVLNGQLRLGPGLIGGEDLPLGPLVADSRQVEPGDVFFAVKDPHHDGESFVGEAFRRGASGAVVARPIAPANNQWILHVEDPLESLYAWAAWKRRRFTGTLIAVAGSAGKTVTRQMIHTVLKSRFKGYLSPKIFKRQAGVPLSLAALEPEHDYAVIEWDANGKREIMRLAGLCRPKVAVITQLDDVRPIDGRQAITTTVKELLGALPEDGRAVLGDDPRLRTLTQNCRAPIAWVGIGGECGLRATDIRSEQGMLHFQVGGAVPTTAKQNGEETVPFFRSVPFAIPVWGRHHVTVALSALAVGRMMGLDLPMMSAALAKHQSLPLRCEVLRLREATVINDIHNTDPTSMRATLELLDQCDGPGRRIVVCGDMVEVGEEASSLHWELGKQCVEIGRAAFVIACGEFARHVAGGARSAGLPPQRTIPCLSVDDALPHLGQLILPGDTVLVVGSRLTAMERVVEAMEQYPQRRSA
jgi:UDP-N-acetylmuramoyl-tripeptide--D-alanyl-D-alanine ligase